MAERFFRNQNASERTTRLNAIVDELDDVEDRVTSLENGGVSPTSPTLDPGDLTVYYNSGKA